MLRRLTGPDPGIHYSLFLQTACEEAVTLTCKSYTPADWNAPDNERQEQRLLETEQMPLTRKLRLCPQGSRV